MLANTVSIDEFRTNLAHLVGTVMYGKDRVVIRKYNRDAAILLSVDDYEKLIDPTKRLNTSQWSSLVKKLDVIRNNIPDVDRNEFEKDLDQAITDVRKKNKNT